MPTKSIYLLLLFQISSALYQQSINNFESRQMKFIDKIGLLVTLSIIPINNLSTIPLEISSHGFYIDSQKFTLNYTILFSVSPTIEIKKSSMVQVVYSNISPWRYHFALMRYSIKRYLNIDDRSVGPRPHRGEMPKAEGVHFPRPKGGCMVF